MTLALLTTLSFFVRIIPLRLLCCGCCMLVPVAAVAAIVLWRKMNGRR